MPNLRDANRPRKRQEKAATSGSLTPGHDATNEPGNKSNGIVHPSQQPDNAKSSRETNSRDDESPGWAGIARGMIYTAVPAWLNMGIMVTLIFGGCCANVSGFPWQFCAACVVCSDGC